MVWTAEEDDLETTTTGLADPFDGRFPARLLDNAAPFDWTCSSEPLVDAVHPPPPRPPPPPRSLWDPEQQDEAAPPNDEGEDDGSLGLMCADDGHDARGCHTSLPSHSSCSHDAHVDDDPFAELLIPCLQWEEGHDAREDEDDDIRTACRAIRPPIEPRVESEEGDARDSPTGSIPCPLREGRQLQRQEEDRRRRCLDSPMSVACTEGEETLGDEAKWVLAVAPCLL